MSWNCSHTHQQLQIESIGTAGCWIALQENSDLSCQNRRVIYGGHPQNEPLFELNSLTKKRTVLWNHSHGDRRIQRYQLRACCLRLYRNYCHSAKSHKPSKKSHYTEMKYLYLSDSKRREPGLRPSTTVTI